MQWGKRKVPCGGSSALCKGTRASPWPPGLHVQPLWALLLLPVWWEMPDPLRNQPKATLARVTQEPGVGKEGSCVPSRSAKCGEGGGWRDLQAPLGARFSLPHHEGHWWSSQRQGGEGGSKPQSSIASSWSARSSNMLLMSSKMFLAECAVPGWLSASSTVIFFSAACSVAARLELVCSSRCWARVAPGAAAKGFADTLLPVSSVSEPGLGRDPITSGTASVAAQGATVWREGCRTCW